MLVVYGWCTSFFLQTRVPTTHIHDFVIHKLQRHCAQPHFSGVNLCVVSFHPFQVMARHTLLADSGKWKDNAACFSSSQGSRETHVERNRRCSCQLSLNKSLKSTLLIWSPSFFRRSTSNGTDWRRAFSQDSTMVSPKYVHSPETAWQQQWSESSHLTPHRNVQLTLLPRW